MKEMHPLEIETQAVVNVYDIETQRHKNGTNKPEDEAIMRAEFAYHVKADLVTMQQQHNASTVVRHTSDPFVVYKHVCNHVSDDVKEQDVMLERDHMIDVAVLALSEVERRYSVTEREALGIHAAVPNFKRFLLAENV